MSMRKVISIMIIGFVCVSVANAQQVLALGQKVSGALSKASTTSGDRAYYNDEYTLSLKAKQKVTITLVSDHVIFIMVEMGGKHYVESPGGAEHTNIQLTFVAGAEPQTAAVHVMGPEKYSVDSGLKTLDSWPYVVSVAAAAKSDYVQPAQEDEYGGN
jgi:hypothetical protein